MKIYNKYFGFLIMAMGLFCQCQANQTMQIHDQQQVSENYYIHPDNLFITPNKMYASIDGILIQIHTLRADERGVFVPHEEIAGRLVKCPFCQHWYDPDDPRGHPCPGFPE